MIRNRKRDKKETKRQNRVDKKSPIAQKKAFYHFIKNG